MHGQVRLVGAVHADHAEEMRIGRRKRAEPHQGQSARKIGKPHQLGEAGAGLGPGVDQPAAAIEKRAFRLSDHLDGLGDPGRIGPQLRTVALVTHLFGRAVGTGREEDILRQIDDDRPGAAALRDVEGLVQYAGQFADVLDEIIVLCAGPGNAGCVGFLERVVADEVRRDLAGQADDRHGVHQRVGQAGDRVGRAGTARYKDDPDTAGRAGIALGRVHGPLLMPHEDVAQRILLEKRIVDRQDGTAGIAEYDIDALVHQSLDDDLRSAQRLGRHHNLHRQQHRARPKRAPPRSWCPKAGAKRSQLYWLGQQKPVNKMT